MRLLLCLFFFISSYTCLGADHPAPAVLHADTGLIVVRHLNREALKAYSRQPEFQYQEVTIDKSWWSRFWAWFWHFFISKTEGHELFLSYFIRYFFIAAGAAALLFLIFKLLGVDIANAFRKKSATAEVDHFESLEDIHEINFDSELERSVGEHNYRLAVRLLYLKCLKQLNDANLINWEVNKTNSAYSNELSNAGLQQSFKHLTRQFEYIWYGEFMIDKAIFEQISDAFQQFKEKMR